MKVRVVALVPVLVLALAGCSGDKPVKATPLPPTPAASASPTPVALEVPEAAKPATAQGAAAFARFYLQVLNEALVSGDLTALRQVSHPDCGFCNEIAAATVKELSEGKRFQGGQYSVVSAEASQTVPGDAVVDVFFDRAASETRDGSGRILSTTPPQKRGFLQVRTLRRGSGWVTRALRFPEVPK